jgi:YD repeat-containing protein
MYTIRKIWACILLLFILPSAYGSPVQYGYDSLNRLTSILYPDGTSVGYTYDEAGNRLSQTLTTTSDSDITVLKNTTQTVYWYYTKVGNNWYIIDATASSNPAVMLLKSIDVTVDGGIRWKPINNYPAFAGYPAANNVFSSITVSMQDRTIQFGTTSASDPDITALANQKVSINWFYIAIKNMSKWYIVESGSATDPAVMFLRYVDPGWDTGLRWKPISNYSAYGGFPAEPVKFETIGISSDLKQITIGNLK